MNKSAQSCIWSIRSLLADCTVAYLWTFTFRECLPIPEACARWMVLQHELVRIVGFIGVRVYELHPGGHGLHIHVVTSGRHNVKAVRHFSDASGFGRIHVKPIPAASADYIAKYLTKARRAPELKGRRLWACLGFKGSKVADCELDSPLTREIAKISDAELKSYYKRMNWQFPTSQQAINFAKFTWAQARLLQHEMSIVMRNYPKKSRDGAWYKVDQLELWMSGKKSARDRFTEILREGCVA